jgi:hypothetical protein
MRRLLLTLVLALLAAAPLAAQDEGKPKVKKHPDLITAAEIAERADLQNVYEAVNRLRPIWLRVRSAGSPDRGPAPIVVYVDGVRMGDLSALQQMPASYVVEIRHLSGNDATTRYGIDHGSGAILVTTTRSGNRPPD